MRKYSTTVLVTLLSMGILVNCKKSGTPAPKDDTASIKDKTWSGALTYSGKKAEYYSVHFNADNSLTWTQLSGEYQGKWFVNSKQLIMTFTGSDTRITADISDDNKLMNIVDNTGYYDVNSGELIVNPNLPLDNTVWKGSYFNGGSQQPLEFSFLPGLGINIKFGAFPADLHTYTRSSSGTVIRFGVGGMYPFFAVISSNNEIKGCTTSSAYPLQATKQ